jgi:ArsR family transcriptional regulator, cadmium/lead-responsive transcriptional repressor
MFVVVRTRSKIDLQPLGRVGEALADPVRRSVLARLAEGPGYPAELAEEIGVSRSGMSNHLACLRGCGFVTATYEGRRVRYTLADPAIADALSLLSRLPLHPCPEDDRS